MALNAVRPIYGNRELFTICSKLENLSKINDPEGNGERKGTIVLEAMSEYLDNHNIDLTNVEVCKKDVGTIEKMKIEEEASKNKKKSH